jgi:hypothetical protein
VAAARAGLTIPALARSDDRGAQQVERGAQILDALRAEGLYEFWRAPT